MFLSFYLFYFVKFMFISFRYLGERVSASVP